MPEVQVPHPPQTVITIEELHRQYGEATIQLKIANQRVMMLEQQIQQVMQSAVPAK